MDPETVANWLREGGDITAAEVVRQCEFKAHYVDTGFPMDGGPEIDIFELQIGVPRRVFDRLSSDLKNEAASIEKAIEDLSRGDHCWVRRVEWVARVYTAHASPSDSEVEDVLKTFDTDHVRSAWSKALARRTHDLRAQSPRPRPFWKLFASTF